MPSTPEQHKNICFVVNPMAGVGQAAELERLIREHCTQHHYKFDIAYTRARAHGTELAARAAEGGCDIVVAVGGDGTINEVAQGLLHTSTVMGIVPRGSGNGLARHLGIPLNTTRAISTLFSSEVLEMDVFRVNGKLSLNVSGIGFDGHITNLFGVKSGRGLLGYVSVTLQEFHTFREFTAEINLGSHSFTRNAFIIAIANSSQYGNNAYIAPAASVCDALLNVNILKKIPLYRMDFLYEFFAGSIGSSPFSEIIETPSIAVRTSIPVAYHVDGEACGLEDNFTIALTPAALKVRRPTAIRTRL